MSVPKLRFKEFDGGWSSLKYKDVNRTGFVGDFFI